MTNVQTVLLILVVRAQVHLHALQKKKVTELIKTEPGYSD
jgi:hypothetical protein